MWDPFFCLKIHRDSALRRARTEHCFKGDDRSNEARGQGGMINVMEDIHHPGRDSTQMVCTPRARSPADSTQLSCTPVTKSISFTTEAGRKSHQNLYNQKKKRTHVKPALSGTRFYTPNTTPKTPESVNNSTRTRPYPTDPSGTPTNSQTEQLRYSTPSSTKP